MFSSATKVKGQGVGSAYTELINLLKKYYSQELNIEINKFNRVNISHYHTIDPQFYLSTFFLFMAIPAVCGNSQAWS